MKNINQKRKVKIRISNLGRVQLQSRSSGFGQFLPPHLFQSHQRHPPSHLVHKYKCVSTHSKNKFANTDKDLLSFGPLQVGAIGTKADLKLTTFRVIAVIIKRVIIVMMTTRKMKMSKCPMQNWWIENVKKKNLCKAFANHSSLYSKPTNRTMWNSKQNLQIGQYEKCRFQNDTKWVLLGITIKDWKWKSKKAVCIKW